MASENVPAFFAFHPEPQDIEELIMAARGHSMGIDFLLDGDLGSVAAMFRVHAFTVEAARAYWAEKQGGLYGISKANHRL